MFLKDADAVLEYRVDWAAALVADVVVASSEWAVEPLEPDGVSISASRLEGPEAVVRLAGGAAGKLYRIGNLVTFSDGTRDERNIVVRVGDR